MALRIDSISFNHDPSSTSTDALTIRRNQVDDVQVPEWTAGMSRPEDSPAAYSINQLQNNRLTIKARFSRDSTDPSSATVNAVGSGPNVLGDIRSQTINFGAAMSAIAVLNLDLVPANPSVGISDITWEWFVTGVRFQTTQHRIYTIVSDPQPPWGQPGSRFPGFQVPWTEVLDQACREAAGARTADEAADSLTRWLFSLGGSKLQYNQGSGDSRFTIPGMQTFKCTPFLELLAAAPGTRSRVNCTDCATILSSFANILGCNLIQSRIGFEFETNLIQKLGQTFPNRQYFTFHEVAWKFPTNGNGNGNGRDAFVYDSCLEFDGDADRTDTNFLPTLGVNIPLGVPGREGYHFRLIAPQRGGSPPEEKPRTRLRRKIGGPTAVRVVRDPEQERRLAERYDFDSWQGTPTEEPERPCQPHRYEKVSSPSAPLPPARPSSDQQLLLNYCFNQKEFSPSGWKLREVEHVEVKPDPLELTDAIWEATDCSTAELRVLTYECSSIPAARLFVLSLLGEFDVPNIERRDKFVIDKKEVELGDVAFADVDELVLLFARANTVLLIQNVARTVVPVTGFAHQLDADITRNPQIKEKDFQESKQFSISEKQIRAGDATSLQYLGGPVTKQKDTLFKFFAPSGQVFLKEDTLFYRPSEAGEQSITILGLKSGQPTLRQVVNVSVEQSLAIQETECREVHKEEERQMPDILGSWSLRRLTSDGNPVDLSVDGFVQIDNASPTGEIRGSYADMESRTVVTVTGYVAYRAGNSFSLVLRHQTPGGTTRQYEGQLVEAQEGDFGIQLVVGRFSAYSETDTGAASDAVVALDSQENGIWVATKP
jgi:hypothetical protein